MMNDILLLSSYFTDSILDVRKVEGHQLLKLRNPWGTFEWKGDWSDTSELWDAHPGVRRSLRPKCSEVDDGTFWMAWVDFRRFFQGVDVCVKTRGMDDLVLHTHEEYRWCGPFVGCLLGCMWYWLCCCGLYKLWCGRKSEQRFGMKRKKKNKVQPS